MRNIFIRSIGYHVPGGRLTNGEVLDRVRDANADRLGADDLDLLLYGYERKLEFLGIETRSIGAPGDSCINMAVKAARDAICKAGLDPTDIDLVIGCGVSNPFMEPSLALALGHRLGIGSGDFFDINDTCNGFMKSMDVAGMYLRAGRCSNALVVSSENPYELAEGLGIDYTIPEVSDADSRFSSLLVGCGAAAAVLTRSASGAESSRSRVTDSACDRFGTDRDSGSGGSSVGIATRTVPAPSVVPNGAWPGSARIVDYREHRVTSLWNASVLTVPGTDMSDEDQVMTSPGLWTDARLVSAQVIKEMPAFINESMEQWGISFDDIGLVVLHQLGDYITFATLGRLGVSEEKAPVNTFREFGNMASANIPINLAIAVEEGRIARGDSVLLASSACGLSYSLTRLEW
jgi:3-oxoacyl-[acyl-carrier-protein] synthase-3